MIWFRMPSIARVIAFKSLLQWEKTRKDPHSIIAGFINDKLKPEDASFARELFFGAIKFKRKLDYYAKAYFPRQQLEFKLKMIIRLGLYQLIQTPNIPDYAVVSEAVELARDFCSTKDAGFVNAVLRNYIRNPQKIRLPDEKSDPVKFLGIQYSYPDWLVQRYFSRFGFDETVKILQSGNAPPDMCFFVNEFITTPEDVESDLENLKICYRKSELFAGYYHCYDSNQLLRSKIFLNGEIIIGDPAQGLAPALLEVPAGETVLDIFSAPGGKTAALANMVGHEGSVIATDISLGRLKILKGNTKRWRLDNVYVLCSDGLKFASRRKFKYILADVPCSGTGVMRRNPDLRWNLKEENIKRLADIQKMLIKVVADKLEHKGRLVYSTCSFEPEENRSVVIDFLKQNKNFCLGDFKGFDEFRAYKGMYETAFHRHSCDGAFIAVIERV